MRTLAFLIVAITLVHSPIYAGSPASKCFDANTNLVFPTTEAVAFGMQLGSKMPQINYNPDGSPISLSWMPLPEHTTEVVQHIGRYMTKGICRVNYTRQMDNPDGKKSESLTVMFGLEEPTPTGLGIRPFFIDADEDLELIREIDSTITSSKDLPFALEIEKTEKGTGVFTTEYVFVFSAGGARILERSESGRNVDTKTFHYDKSGKIEKTETSENR